MIKIKTYLILIALLFCNSAMAIDENTILQYINEYRMQRHLHPLKLDPRITMVAAQHSRDMATKKVPFGHTYFSSRIKQLYNQMGNAQGGAENVAYYKLNAKKLVNAWIASRGHRKNIEGNYNLTGIGIAYSKEGWAYYTQIFLRMNEQKPVKTRSKIIFG